MGFKKRDVEKLLVDTGRECCICNTPHQVSAHHIVGGTDEIDNAISLCPNCHDVVHGSSAPGRTSRAYTPDELRQHREEKIRAVARRRLCAPMPAREDTPRLAVPQAGDAALEFGAPTATKTAIGTDSRGEQTVAFRLELTVTNPGPGTVRDAQVVHWTPGVVGHPVPAQLRPDTLHHGTSTRIAMAETVVAERPWGKNVLQCSTCRDRAQRSQIVKELVDQGTVLRYSCVCQVVADRGRSPLLAVRFAATYQDGTWSEPAIQQEEIAEQDVPAHVYLR